MAAGSLIYMDVRSRQELETDGAIVGSYVVPSKSISSSTLRQKKRRLTTSLIKAPELDQAFQLDDAAFLAKYCFPKPAKDATDVVVACKSGRRALAAINKLRAVGYDGLR